MLTTMKKGEKDWDEDMLVNEVFGSNEAKLTFVKRMLSESKKRKNGDKMLVMGKTSCSIDHDNLLMDQSV